MMDLKDLCMDKLELTDATRALMVGILKSIDWDKSKEQFYENYTNELRDVQREAIENMFREMQESVEQQDELFDEVGDYLVELGFPDAFEDLMKQEESEEPDEENE